MDDRSRPSALGWIREYQLSLVLPLFPPGCRVLDVGAGAGWHARALAGAGFQVAAIDVRGAEGWACRVWPVTVYDGVCIPFPDSTFDVILSSHVLEHVEDADSHQRELRRVLRPGGIAVVILPTATWRAWNLLLHHPFKLKSLLVAASRSSRTGQSLPTVVAQLSPGSTMAGAMKRALWPRRHGVHGRLLSEPFLFSRRRWSRQLERSGWDIIDCRTDGLFCSGHFLLGLRLDLARREVLASLLGSSSHIFILR